MGHYAKENVRGVITDIHRTSTVDGPGIRTTVFTKGCPLRCIWCHNPETQRREIEHGYGREVTVKEVVEECLKDRVYYEESGGGVTLSGGEPVSQHRFTFEVLRQLKAEGIHTTLDTTGFGPTAVFEESLEVTDLYLFDYKATDPRLHLDLTNVMISPVLRTLQLLVDAGAAIIVRCPVIPKVNDDADHLHAIADLENRYPGLVRIELLPWHTMGMSKYERLGRAMDQRLPAENTSQETKNRYRAFFVERGSRNVTVVS